MCNNTDKFKEQLCDLSTAFTVGVHAMARQVDEIERQNRDTLNDRETLEYVTKYHQDREDLAKLRKIEVQLTRVDQDIHSQEGHDPIECRYVTKEKI